MSFWQEVSANVIAYGAVLSLATIAVLAILWYRPGIWGKLLPLQRIRKGNWSGAEVLFALVLFLFLPGVVRDLFLQMGLFENIYGNVPAVDRQLLWIYLLYFFLFLALLFFGLFRLSGTRPSHIGLSLARWPQGVIQGVLVFAIATPVILCLYYLMGMVFDVTSHPFDKLAQEGLWPIEWALLFFQACIAAPMLEELLCRGLLQGWLRRASIAGHIMVCVWTLFIASIPLMNVLAAEENPGMGNAWQPLAFAGLLVGWYGLNFFQVWRGILREGPFYLMIPVPKEVLQQRIHEEESEDATEQEKQPLLQVDPGRWQSFQGGSVRLSIFGSAMLFAVGHSPAWPSPVVLYVFGLILGWLTYRTQSLIGAMVMHGCFNAVAFGTLLYMSTLSPTNGNDETTTAWPVEGGKTVIAAPASQCPRLR